MSETHLIHVMLVSGRDTVSDWLMTTLRSEAGVVLANVAPTLERAAALIDQRRIDIVLLDASVPDAKQLERLQAMSASPLNPATIVMVDPGDMSYLQQAMLAGARGFLLKPFTQAQLMDSLRQTFGILTQQRQVMSAVAVAAPREQSAEIVALFSPKGGVGRTSLAASLAVALHQDGRAPVTLVDGDLQFGDVDVAMNVVARKSAADLLGYVNELEPALIDSALTEHNTGVRLLLSPPYFDPALETDGGRLAHVIKMLASAQKGGYVIVDAPAGLGESSLNLLDVSRRVLLVTEANVASLRATKRFLELAAKMEFPENKIVLVLSGYRKEYDTRIAEMERHLGWPIAVTIPSDPLAMALAFNQGQPILCRDRNHPVSKAVLRLAQHLNANGTGDTVPIEEADHSRADRSTEDRVASMSLMRMLRPKQALG